MNTYTAWKLADEDEDDTENDDNQLIQEKLDEQKFPNLWFAEVGILTRVTKWKGVL